MLTSDRSKNVVIAAALAAALGLVAVRRLPRLLFERATYSDGTSVYTDLGDVRHAVWSAPERLGDEVNSPAREGRPTLSPDGRWMVFAVGEPGLSCDLWIAELAAGLPREARPLLALNTPADELAPAFSQDGLYFASDRSGGQGGYDLWFASFADGQTGAAEPVAGGLNSPADELDPAPTRDAIGERVLAFASDRARDGRGGLDLYLARLDRPLSAATDDVELERLAALSSAGDDREPAFVPGGRTLYLASDRDSPGQFAIYRSLLEDGTWLPPRRVEGLGKGAARAPAPSADGFTLLFEAWAPATEEGSVGDSDLYRARSIELLRRPPPALGWMDLLLVGLLLATALLAWLAKRWHELDVLYKCFLASVIAHLLLMWLLGEVYPEGDARPPGEGDGPTFRVRILDDSSLAARTRERGGTLEVAPAEMQLASAPTRLEPEVAPARPAAAPAAEIARAEAQAAPAPSREPDLVVREVSNEPRSAVAVRTPEERFDRLDGVAPALELEAQHTEASREIAPANGPAPTDLAHLAAEGARRSSAPGRADLEAPRAGPGEGPAFRGAPTKRSGELVDRGVTVTLAAPSERFERLAATPAAEPGLPEAVGFAPAANSSGEPAPTPWEPGAELTASPRPSAAPAVGSTLSVRGSDLPAPTAAAPSQEVARTVSPPAQAAGPALAAPVERFEPLARGDSTPATPALPSASSFAPSRAGAAEAPAPARWTAALEATAPPRVPDSPPPVEALAASPRKDVHDLPAPPTKLDDTPYRARFGTEKAVALAEHGGGEDTERAVALGLEYLASIQTPDGAWGDPRRRDRKYRQVAIGKTGLALLAFLGAGHTPQSGEHADVVRRAAEFLLARQDRRTGHFGDGSAYSHGIATYALAECFALTHDEVLREPLERAVLQILRHQVHRGDERVVGGWSYYYRDDETFDRWPRVSISAWQVMALESARLGGLEVLDESFEAARRFLLRSWDTRLGAFRYSQDPDRLRSRYATLPGSTPAALFALSLLGEDLASEPFVPARRYTLERAPAGFRYRGDEAFVARAVGNVYFWYYGSLALFRLGGAEWERWNVALKETLLPAQESDGSWRPLDIYAKNYAGDDDDDRSYTTAMCVLSLEVYYRYFTPLLQVR